MRRVSFIILSGIILSGAFKMDLRNPLFEVLYLRNAQAAQKPLPDNKDMIEIFDDYGRKMMINKEEWRKNILPRNINLNWNDPDALYQDIEIALRDEFFTELIKASERLIAIDKNKERSYIVRSIVLMKNNRNKEAKEILQSYINKYGETGYVLTNLAKAYANENNNQKAEELLLKGLQLDPNQDNAIEWWIAIQNAKGGKPAYLSELKKLSDIKGSWRPQLWLAREALQQKDLPTAIRYYKHVISLAKDEGDVLMQISGDLGQNGYYEEIFKLVLPIYDPKKHNVWPGINILQAYLESKKYEEGEKFLKKMLALNRPDIWEKLTNFSEQFETKLQNFPNIPKEKEKISSSIVCLDKPIFIYGLKDADWFLPDIKRNGPKIGLMPLAVIDFLKKENTGFRRESDAGRLSRSIPLYIEERFYFETNSDSQVLIPVAKDYGAMITSSKESGVNYFLDAVSKSKKRLEFDYYVSGSLIETDGSWEIILSIWDCRSKQKIKSLAKKVPFKVIGQSVRDLSNDLFMFLKKRAGLVLIKPADYYRRLKDNLIENQLLSYSQALVQVLVVNNYGSKNTISGESFILRNSLDLALWSPESILPKILFISSLVKSYSYKSDIYIEFKDYAIKLINENSDNKEVMKFSPLIYKIYGMNEEMNDFEKGIGKYPQSYQEWFKRIKEME